LLRLVRRLLGTGPRGWRDLVRAQSALLEAQRRLRREPIGSLAIRATVRAEDVRGDSRRAMELALAVRRVARYGLIRPYCLVRALAIRELLSAEGIDGASIRIGVRRHEGEFQAHAWIRWGDTILGDDAWHVQQFTEVDDLRVMARR
jgi:Transglutaminase-like superfamily